MARNKAYRDAEKEIEAAHPSGTTELDLSDMGLTELPESLWKLTQLWELNLRNQALLKALRGMRSSMVDQHEESIECFDQLDAGQRELLSKADADADDAFLASDGLLHEPHAFLKPQFWRLDPRAQQAAGIFVGASPI